MTGSLSRPTYNRGVITVHFFASLREAVGSGRLELPFSEDATVRDLFRELCRAHPSLEPYAGFVRAAVNQTYSEWDTPLSDGDEIAFFPPVSGGGR